MSEANVAEEVADDANEGCSCWVKVAEEVVGSSCAIAGCGSVEDDELCSFRR